jgi:hypothetical protein
MDSVDSRCGSGLCVQCAVHRRRGVPATETKGRDMFPPIGPFRLNQRIP